MAKLIALVLTVLTVTFVSAQTGSTCQFNQQSIQENIMECMAHEPSLFLQVITHLKNPQSMATMGFICENPKAVVDVLVCLEEKYAACFPTAKDLITQYMPDRNRWTDAVNFMCAHKTEMLENNCMGQSQVQDFMQCYMSKVMTIVQTAHTNPDIQATVCSIIHSEEQCIKTYHGMCSQSYVDLVIQFLDKLVPYCSGPSVEIKNQAIDDARGSILLQGVPLKFQPKYNVVNG